MIWYGRNPRKSLNSTRLRKRRFNKKTQLSNIVSVRTNRLAYKHYFFYIPPTWDALVYKVRGSASLHTYMYSGVYYVNIKLPNHAYEVSASSNASVIGFKTLYSHNSMRLYFSELGRMLSIFYKPLFRKIKFKGKGYYIYKNLRNTITPQFGYSHRLYVYAYFTTVKFLGKTSVLVFGLYKPDLALVTHSIKNMRPINIFTGRGVRFSKQIIYKKTGKVSSYR